MRDLGKLFGQRLKLLLEETDEKQVELARLLNVSEVTVSRYVKGRIPDDANTLVAIANHFGVTVDFLLGRVEDRQGLAPSSGVARATPDQPLEEDLVVLFRGKRQELTPEYKRLLIAMIEAVKADEKNLDKK